MDKLKVKLPDKPGVYFFKKGRQVLYIGKATSLKDRVKSYFGKDLMETRGPKLVEMLEKATKVEYEETDSALEALVLEAKLIKRYQPYYNTKEKDDKSYNYVVLTKEEFPRVLVVRGKDLIESWHEDEIAHKYGPFPQGNELREAMRIVRRIFPFRDKCEPGDGRPCFNAQIGLCPGVCSGLSASEYKKILRHIRLFFDGRKGKIVELLQGDMKRASKSKEFERAARLRDQIYALNHINDVAILKREVGASSVGRRVEAYDIAHLSGNDTTGAMVVVIDGHLDKSEYKRFKMKGSAAKKNDDVANLEELLRRRFSHSEWPTPDIVVIDGGVGQRNRALRVLESMNIEIPVISVVKDEKHKPREILGESDLVRDYRTDALLANSEAHRFAVAYHRKLMRKRI